MSGRQRISGQRQGVFIVGTVLMALGGIGVLVCFVGFATSGFRAVGGPPQFGSSGVENPFSWWLGVLFSGIALTIGRALRTLGARGIAGSGLVLDPERARRDLEPFARMGGGMVRDALEETGLVGQDAPTAEPKGETVKIRCRECRALNDEDARFCDHCGAKL
ncbi:MAG: zinc ribbon domain-containing protein [Planctomycetota bacterium]